MTSSLFKTYYHLTKPGIIFGNAITAAGGFLLASNGEIKIFLFLATLLGISLVIASACVFNNYLDREIDKKMERTKNRALVRGLISSQEAIIFASLLGIIGFLTLAYNTNPLTTFIGFIGFFFYVALYTFIKRQSVYGTLIGSISGAVPPVVGYCAVVNQFDTGAVLLFLILTLWQMPHFYAIAIYRYEDYKAASIPALPIKQGIYVTKIHITLYIIAFIVASSMLTVFSYTGYLYLVTVFGFSLYWLWLSLKGFKSGDDKKWARQLFKFSLIVLMSLFIIIPVDIALA